MAKLYPSILSADFSRLGAEILEAEKAGADGIHVDVMDGHFVPNLTIGPVVVESIRKVTGLPFDVHLMIERPEEYIVPFARVGADLITFHIEVVENPGELIEAIRQEHKMVGVSLNPETPLAVLEPVLPYVDLVLVMSVHPGFGGQEFIPESLRKVSALEHIVRTDDLDIEIEVDGGVGADNAGKLVAAGADILVAGSAVFRGRGITKEITAIKAVMGKAT